MFDDRFIKQENRDKKLDDDWLPLTFNELDIKKESYKKDFSVFLYDQERQDDQFKDFFSREEKEEPDEKKMGSELEQEKKRTVQDEKEILLKQEEQRKQKEIFLKNEERRKEEENVNQKLKEGYDNGFIRGKKEGFEQGKEEGYKEGFDKGKEEGFFKGKEEGLDKGLFEGEEKGYEEGQKKAADIVKQISNVLSKLETHWQDMVSVNENKILDLIFKVVEKIIYTKLETDNEIIKKTIIDVFKAVPESSANKVNVSISPEDYKYIELIKEDFFKEIDKNKTISFNPNPSLNRGDCRIETKSGTIDTTVEERIELVKDSLMRNI